MTRLIIIIIIIITIFFINYLSFERKISIKNYYKILLIIWRRLTTRTKRTEGHQIYHAYARLKPMTPRSWGLRITKRTIEKAKNFYWHSDLAGKLLA